MRLRGIIDRLDMNDDGSLTVVDYKTGRAPSDRYERSSLVGVQTYALLCESAARPAAGRGAAAAPARARRHLHGGDGTDHPRASRRTVAVWSAIERACDTEDFRPQVGPLCNYCAFKPACPAFAAA